MTTIEWTMQTWNPVLGCSKISEGCRNCYAIQQAYRNWNMAQALPKEKRGRLAYYEGLTEKIESEARPVPKPAKVEWTGKVVFVPEALEIPLKRKKPTTYFVNSMSDLFHESVRFDDILRIFMVMRQARQHTFQVLTKRPDRMLEFMRDWYPHAEALANMSLRQLLPPSNVWLGVTVENQRAANERIPLLLKTPAAIRFLSCEPLLEEVDLTRVFDGAWYTDCLRGIGAIDQKLDWVIVGGESGSDARACHMTWLAKITQDCQLASVPVFVKQLGSASFLSGKSERVDAKHIRILEPYVQFKTADRKGGDIEEFPDMLQVRQFPVQP